MNIIISRYRFKQESINGRLSIDGMRICDTLENINFCLPAGQYTITCHKCPFRKRNIPLILIHKDVLTASYAQCTQCLEKSMKREQIQREEYDLLEKAIVNQPDPVILRSYEQDLHRQTHERLKQEGLTSIDGPLFCPQIAVGNGIHNVQNGSIYVGTFNGISSIIRSKSAFDCLYERIRKTIERGNEITLTIVES